MAYQGLGNAYVSVDDLRPYDGNILQLDILNGAQLSGEILNVDIWPVVGVGIGLLGVRAHVGPLGVGVGTLFYKPVAWGDMEAVETPEMN
jgi:hypothetical protein